VDPERVVGVDFSAARSAAGRRTWIAEASVEAGRLELTDLSDASARLDCAPSREATLDALVEYLTTRRPPTVVGLDVPFSLPAALVEGDWRTFLDGTPEAWGRLGRVDSPRALYDAATDLADRADVSLLRATDEARGGQAPTGFRIKTQTYYGVSAVLRRVADDVAVAPFDDATGADTVLVETYPAALFEALPGGHRRGYKRDTRAGVETRRANVDALCAAGVEVDDHAVVAAATDDALDAVAAAVAAWRAARRDFATGSDAGPLVEGHIYA
jgi:hypothetical protein